MTCRLKIIPKNIHSVLWEKCIYSYCQIFYLSKNIIHNVDPETRVYICRKGRSTRALHVNYAADAELQRRKLGRDFGYNGKARKASSIADWRSAAVAISEFFLQIILYLHFWELWIVKTGESSTFFIPFL